MVTTQEILKPSRNVCSRSPFPNVLTPSRKHWSGLKLDWMCSCRTLVSVNSKCTQRGYRALFICSKRRVNSPHFHRSSVKSANFSQFSFPADPRRLGFGAVCRVYMSMTGQQPKCQNSCCALFAPLWSVFMEAELSFVSCLCLLSVSRPHSPVSSPPSVSLFPRDWKAWSKRALLLLGSVEPS